MLRLASRGQDYMPQDNPVLARIAEQVGITVSDWFARLPASEVVGRIEAEWNEPEQKPIGSTPTRAPKLTMPSEPEHSPARAVPPETISRPPSSAPITPTPVPSTPSSVGPPPAEVDGLLKYGKELFATGD